MSQERRVENLPAKPRTIGRLAKEAGVNVETIRFYERRGLLRKPKMPANGWRIYEESAVWVVHYIKLARQLGFTLKEIKKVMGNLGRGRSFCLSVQQAYQDKIRMISEKITQLIAARRELNKTLIECRKRSLTGDCPIAQRCSAQFDVTASQILTQR